MGVISFNTETIGQVGQIPKIIYVHTNDTIAHVTTTPGYLNQIIDQGGTLSPTDLALISTTDAPFASLFSLIFSNGNWSTSVYMPPGGVAFNPANSYTITGNWAFNNGFSVTSTSDMPLVTTGTATFSGTNVNIEANGGILTLVTDTNNILIESSAGNLIVSTSEVFITAAEGNLNLESTFGNVAITSDAAEIDLTALTINLNASSGNVNLASASGSVTINSFQTMDFESVADITLHTFNNLNLSGDISVTFTSSTGDITFNGVGTNFNVNAFGINAAEFQAEITDAVDFTVTNTFDVQAGLSSMSISSGDFFINSDATLELLSNSDMTITSEGNLLITGNIPGTPPGGSAVLMWDPIGKQIYHA